MRASGKASNQFSKYDYSGTVATTAIFLPPDGTIVMTSSFPADPQDMNVQWAAYIIRAGAEMGATETGTLGSIMCDGVEVGFKNLDPANATLKLSGMTLA